MQEARWQWVASGRGLMWSRRQGFRVGGGSSISHLVSRRSGHIANDADGNLCSLQCVRRCLWLRSENQQLHDWLKRASCRKRCAWQVAAHLSNGADIEPKLQGRTGHVHARFGC